ncbi:hypothetical protein [Solirhodobacter olei]|uniref:hypothetical protein n=1 Tax=Solirhodobacter olei TaxID=2493082 RepID=UPI000FD77793|nr:hypothetical protein [Solirhodobacter olei]
MSLAEQIARLRGRRDEVTAVIDEAEGELAAHALDDPEEYRRRREALARELDELDRIDAAEAEATRRLAEEREESTAREREADAAALDALLAERLRLAAEADATIRALEEIFGELETAGGEIRGLARRLGQTGRAHDARARAEAMRAALWAGAPTLARALRLRPTIGARKDRPLAQQLGDI